MRDPRLPAPMLGSFVILLASIGGSVAGMLAFVAEDGASLAITTGFAVVLVASAIGVLRGLIWGGPLFSIAVAVASLLAISTGSVGQVAGSFGLLLALVVSWGVVRAGYRKLRDLPPVEPKTPEIVRGSPFVSHVYVEFWIVVAVLGVIASIVVPLLLKK